MKLFILLLAFAAGTVACGEQADTQPPSTTAVPATEAVKATLTKQEQLWGLVVNGFADLVHDAEAPFIEVESLRPVSEEAIDQLWSLMSKGHESKVLQVVGFVGQSKDLERLIERAGDDEYDKSAFGIGVFANREDLGGSVTDKALAFLVNCSNPSWQRQTRGESLPSAKVYGHAIDCVYGLSVVRSASATRQLQQLSEADHSPALSKGDSKRFRVEALASSYRLRRLESYGGSIGHALTRSRRDDPRLTQALSDIADAAKALGISIKEIMDDK